MFGEGPMLEGHWYNPKTGDSFTVRDTFFEDNNLIVMTTDGRRMNYDMISKYVKTDKPMPKQKPVAKKQEIPQSILNQVLPTTNNGQLNQPIKKNNYDNLLTDEDKKLLGVDIDPGILQVNNDTDVYSNAVPRPEIKLPVQQTTQEDEDTMLIRRILKRATAPSVDCRITWKNFPAKQFDMLEMMAVEPEKIADYYLSNINLESLRDIVKRGITDYIDKMLTPHEVKLEIPEEEPVYQGDPISSGEKEATQPAKEGIATSVRKTAVRKSNKPASKSTTKKTTKKK